VAKSKTRFDYLSTSSEVRSEWERLCPIGEYRILPSGSLPSVVPEALREKCIDSLVMASGSFDDGMAYFVVNLERKDSPDGAVDQMPFCLWFSGSAAAPSGCLVQHGDWQERTVAVPTSFFSEVQRTGIGQYLGLLSIPTQASGSLASLSGSSHAGAFARVVDHVKTLDTQEE
jgi:hypothetical protein